MLIVHGNLKGHQSRFGLTHGPMATRVATFLQTCGWMDRSQRARIGIVGSRLSWPSRIGDYNKRWGDKNLRPINDGASWIQIHKLRSIVRADWMQLKPLLRDSSGACPECTASTTSTIDLEEVILMSWYLTPDGSLFRDNVTGKMWLERGLDQNRRPSALGLHDKLRCLHSHGQHERICADVVYIWLWSFAVTPQWETSKSFVFLRLRDMVQTLCKTDFRPPESPSKDPRDSRVRERSFW